MTAIEMVQIASKVERHLHRHAEGSRQPLRAAVGMYIAGGDACLGAGRLARFLSITSGATTRVIDRMESLGWATRIRHTADKRQVSVCLTQAGCQKAIAFPSDLNNPPKEE